MKRLLTLAATALLSGLLIAPVSAAPHEAIVIQKEEPSVQKEAVPVQKEAAPLQKEAVPVRKEVAPVQKEEAQVQKSEQGMLQKPEQAEAQKPEQTGESVQSAPQNAKLSKRNQANLEVKELKAIRQKAQAEDNK